ncbi:hypothetical protein D3C75_1178620 [compost metagenome]
MLSPDLDHRLITMKTPIGHRNPGIIAATLEIARNILIAGNLAIKALFHAVTRGARAPGGKEICVRSI